MELTNKKWKEFTFTEVFVDIQRGKRLKKDDHIVGTIPYASSTALNKFVLNLLSVESLVKTLGLNITFTSLLSSAN